MVYNTKNCGRINPSEYPVKDPAQKILSKLTFEENLLANLLFGRHGENVRIIERTLGVDIGVRGNMALIQGEEGMVRIAEKVLQDLYELLKEGHPLTQDDVRNALRITMEREGVSLKEIVSEGIYIPFKNKIIVPKSPTQRAYIQAIRGHDLVFGIGPAGTGKTYLAMAMAVEALSKKEVERIILTRPAVEAGEKLGFLPGDILEKVNPYLRPLYDALHDMMNFDKAMKLVERGVIEVAPLAFMRGRTLNDSFVILDEAQNTTTEQMKMFLTRLGFGSKAVITGDITQIDLPSTRASGLIEAKELLQGIEGIAFVFFTEKDVVRHPLVQEIIRAYEEKEKKETIPT